MKWKLTITKNDGTDFHVNTNDFDCFFYVHAVEKCRIRAFRLEMNPYSEWDKD